MIGGACKLQGAVSPNNGRPLLQHASVTLTRGGFWIPGWKSYNIHLLYSWQCNIYTEDFSYRETPTAIEVVEYAKGVDDTTGFPYEGYPSLFPPVRCDLLEIPPREQAIISRLNAVDSSDPDYKYNTPGAEDLSNPRHQFGGEPFLFNPDTPRKTCPLCREEMTLVATIANENYSDADGFFGNDYVQVVYWCCPPCLVISARNFAD